MRLNSALATIMKLSSSESLSNLQMRPYAILSKNVLQQR